MLSSSGLKISVSFFYFLSICKANAFFLSIFGLPNPPSNSLNTLTRTSHTCIHKAPCHHNTRLIVHHTWSILSNLSCIFSASNYRSRTLLCCQVLPRALLCVSHFPTMYRVFRLLWPAETSMFVAIGLLCRCENLRIDGACKYICRITRAIARNCLERSSHSVSRLNIRLVQGIRSKMQMQIFDTDLLYRILLYWKFCHMKREIASREGNNGPGTCDWW